MGSYRLDIIGNEALGLFESFARLDDTDKLHSEHAAEHLALQQVSAKIDRTTSAGFSPDHESLLAAARASPRPHIMYRFIALLLGLVGVFWLVMGFRKVADGLGSESWTQDFVLGGLAVLAGAVSFVKGQPRNREG
jgi:ferric-dicitrate binding protein FerR (iron transport regulator)